MSCGKDKGDKGEVAWTRTDRTGRVAFTTLGHPDDFKQPSMRRLALQMMLWALDRDGEIPDEGVDATTVGVFDPTPTGIGGAREGVPAGG